MGKDIDKCVFCTNVIRKVEGKTKCHLNNIVFDCKVQECHYEYDHQYDWNGKRGDGLPEEA